MNDDVEVWLDAEFLTERLHIGSLAHDRGAVRFRYEPAWLTHPVRFAIDPDLSLDEGVFHPKPDQGNFRVFDDSRSTAPQPCEVPRDALGYQLVTRLQNRQYRFESSLDNRPSLL